MTTRICISSGTINEVVTFSSDDTMPSTMDAFLAVLSQKLVHINITENDVLTIYDKEFECDVVVLEPSQIWEVTPRKLRVVPRGGGSNGAGDSDLTLRVPSATFDEGVGRGGGGMGSRTNTFADPNQQSFLLRQTTIVPSPLGIEAENPSLHSSGSGKIAHPRDMPHAPTVRHPLRVFLVRHGESQANIDRTVYRTVPDHAVELTDRGKKMAFDAGKYLRRYFQTVYGNKCQVGHHVRMYTSPFMRTRQTAQEMLRAMNDSRVQWVDSVRESALLAEQDWGYLEGEGQLAKEKYQDEMKRVDLKKDFSGRFWARLPGGESVFDVCQRVSGIIPDIMNAASTGTSERQPVRTIIVVSHGVTCRAFLTMWTRLSPEWFAESWNPPNCSIQLMEDQHYRGYLFGGWEEGKEGPLDVTQIPNKGDPQHSMWSTYLNQLMGSDNGI